jgi:hypothetical protein
VPQLGEGIEIPSFATDLNRLPPLLGLDSVESRTGACASFRVDCPNAPLYCWTRCGTLLPEGMGVEQTQRVTRLGLLGLWSLMLFQSGSAHAQELASLAGNWQAEPMTVRWVIGEWGEACGPRPSGGGDSGGPVTIEERGNELQIAGSAGTYSTDRCWDMDPTLVRQNHTGGRRAWKTTCRTPPNDARQQILQTSITATDELITFQETGQYQFGIQGQKCSASSGRWRTYRRLAAGASPVVPPPEPAVKEVPRAEPRPAASNPCARPGAPARIEVRPARKLMRSGETFQFRASVLDGRGCLLRTPVSWRLSPPDSAVKLQDGRLVVPAGAPDARLEVVATVANQAVTASVDVVSNERYQALLATGEFNSEGASAEAKTATITSGAMGAGELGEPEPEGRKWTFVGLVSAIAIALGAVGAWLLRRANRSRKKVRKKSPATSDPGTVMFAEGNGPAAAPPARADATRLEPMSQGQPQAPPPAPVKALTVCPVCGTLYETRDLGACPKDGARLLPVNA